MSPAVIATRSVDSARAGTAFVHIRPATAASNVKRARNLGSDCSMANSAFNVGQYAQQSATTQSTPDVVAPRDQFVVVVTTMGVMSWNQLCACTKPLSLGE